MNFISLGLLLVIMITIINSKYIVYYVANSLLCNKQIVKETNRFYLQLMININRN
jgi:hypothetical protein